uniref:Uncharacterized protein n=1 Tax=Panagrolaimus superbus TaxID=310955 RepID=A0A914ZAD4_9BILA
MIEGGGLLAQGEPAKVITPTRWPRLMAYAPRGELLARHLANHYRRAARACAVTFGEPMNILRHLLLSLTLLCLGVQAQPIEVTDAMGRTARHFPVLALVHPEPANLIAGWSDEFKTSFSNEYETYLKRYPQLANIPYCGSPYGRYLLDRTGPGPASGSGRADGRLCGPDSRSGHTRLGPDPAPDCRQSARHCDRLLCEPAGEHRTQPARIGLRRR